jgi:hypothetical protein
VGVHQAENAQQWLMLRSNKGKQGSTHKSECISRRYTPCDYGGRQKRLFVHMPAKQKARQQTQDHCTSGLSHRNTAMSSTCSPQARQCNNAHSQHAEDCTTAGGHGRQHCEGCLGDTNHSLPASAPLRTDDGGQAACCSHTQRCNALVQRRVQRPCIRRPVVVHEASAEGEQAPGNHGQLE